MNITAADALAVFKNADCLFDNAAVESAIVEMATKLNHILEGDHDVVALCVMTGGVILAGKLLPLLDAPLLIDYLHASRYRGATSYAGASTHFLADPRACSDADPGGRLGAGPTDGEREHDSPHRPNRQPCGGGSLSPPGRGGLPRQAKTR